MSNGPDFHTKSLPFIMENLTRKPHDMNEVSVDENFRGPSTEVAASTAELPYIVEQVDACAISNDQRLLTEWRALLKRGTSPEKIFQTPEFFNYALIERNDEAGLQLYIVRSRVDSRCVCILPVRKITQKFEFRLGPVRFISWKVPALQIMGSVPLLDNSLPDLMGFILQHVLRLHSDCRILSMQAIPAEELPRLQALPYIRAFIHQGLRDCHTLPLPADFDSYLQKFSSKKRYNLSRQVRLLGEQAGAVELLRIAHPEQVPMLVSAVRSILGAHRGHEFEQHTRLEQLALHGILHSYVVRCGNEEVAFIYGIRSSEVWHVYKIAALGKYHGLSAGTSAVHLALQDVISNFSFRHVDFGYGTPNQEFRSTHVLMPRAFVFLCQSRSVTALVLTAHNLWQRAEGALTNFAKAFLRKRKERREHVRN